jgi:hypothetical protein
VALDPIISLAFSLADAPGSCVCFLGAGVSVDAGVPTSWGILQDGLRRLHQQEIGSDSAATEAEFAEWLNERGFDHLGYDALEHNCTTYRKVDPWSACYIHYHEFGVSIGKNSSLADSILRIRGILLPRSGGHLRFLLLRGGRKVPNAALD